MKIVCSNINSCELSSIADGDVFEYKGVLYLKTDKIFDNDKRRACVRLENGHIDWLSEEIFVYKREVKVVVE